MASSDPTIKSIKTEILRLYETWYSVSGSISFEDWQTLIKATCMASRLENYGKQKIESIKAHSASIMRRDEVLSAIFRRFPGPDRADIAEGVRLANICEAALFPKRLGNFERATRGNIAGLEKELVELREEIARLNLVYESVLDGLYQDLDK